MGNTTKNLRSNLRDFSVDVKREWQFLKEYTRQNFDRLPTVKPVPLENAKECGDVPLYDAKWDSASGKKARPLPKYEGTTFDVSLFEDPVMVELIEKEVANIYTTEQVAAVLMCATKSNYSWDLVIKVCDGFIFIDKRDEEKETNILNLQTVCETSLEH